MRASCPHCSSTDIARIRRSGVLDQIRVKFKLWPYRCLECTKRFHLHVRFIPGVLTKPREAAPPASYRDRSMRPMAKLGVKPENQEQQPSVLLALNSAVSAQQPSLQDSAQSAISK